MDREGFKELLKEKGLKVTSQRISVLEVLASSQDKHLTAEEIYELVKECYPEIGLATVYRTIQLLLELDLINRINLNEGVVRYEINDTVSEEGKHHHHHLICLSCGKVMAFEQDLLDILEKKVEETKEFQIVNHELKFYGYCKDCTELNGKK